jgi:hypothetical protein
MAACAEDWLRLAALQLTGRSYAAPVLDPDWVRRSSTPRWPWLQPARLPSSITTHAGIVLKTSQWPYDDVLVDRQQRDLSYLGLPLVAAAARKRP